MNPTTMEEAMSDARAMCDNCNVEAEVDEMLADLREMAIETKDFKTLRMLRKVRWRPSLKNQVVEEVKTKALQSLVASGRVGEFGDGEFGKWLIEWFSDEGWKIIIEFIKAIVGLF